LYSTVCNALKSCLSGQILREHIYASEEVAEVLKNHDHASMPVTSLCSSAWLIISLPLRCCGSYHGICMLYTLGHACISHASRVASWYFCTRFHKWDVARTSCPQSQITAVGAKPCLAMPGSTAPRFPANRIAILRNYRILITRRATSSGRRTLAAIWPYFWPYFYSLSQASPAQLSLLISGGLL
jgi:hypothetical protein